MANLDEGILLNELKHRYDRDKIYTYVGDILVAVNPFKKVAIYEKANHDKYVQASKAANPPHIFAIADQAYNNMVKGGRDQCTVISGESGAGKTETAKYMMKHIIKLCSKGVGSEGSSLEQKIIQVNPLLEAFGNAKTVMNNNSSRFGKYTNLKFDSRGLVVGAVISEYLLEKSRVVRQATGEQNFHIFYMVFATEHASNHGLIRNSDFLALCDQRQTGGDFRAMFAELKQALNDVGFSGDEQYNMMEALAGILHFRNVTFDAVYSDKDPATISSPRSVLERTAQLLGLDQAEIEEGLLFETMITRGETIKKTNTCDKCSDVRDALAKTVYGRIFGWIVSHINTLMSHGSDGMASNNKVTDLGILDIFGFENFAVNSFEQLCINVTNEQLQNFFNKHIFANELEEYRREGIDGNQIKFEDNGPLLKLFFNSKPPGMFKMLDEQCNFPRATDDTLVALYKAQVKEPKYYIAERSNDALFTINHYAGQVRYTADKFLEKNRDTLAAKLVSACQQSSNALINDIFNGEVSETGAVIASARSRTNSRGQVTRPATQTAKRTITVGAQFENSLRVLMEKLDGCAAHFVRCIKPNLGQAANRFEDKFVTDQLRYTGMLETCRIRREGYSYRPSFDNFMERFGLLAYAPSANFRGTAATCTKVMNASKVQGWLMGRTKVFLKYHHVDLLDQQINRFHYAAIVVQKWGRRYLAQLLRRRIIRDQRVKDQEAVSFFRMSKQNIDGMSAKIQRQLQQDSRRPKHELTGGEKPEWWGREPTEAELKREASIDWWRTKERPRGAGQDGDKTLPWFHGLISRKESEKLLASRTVGCFLVRVSENRLGYTLSYRIRDRCKHYMVEQDTRGRYALVGVEKICDSLNGLVAWFQRNQINEAGDMLRDPCGQNVDDNGYEENDLEELYGTVDHTPVKRSRPPIAEETPPRPPSISRTSKPGGSGADIPPPRPPSISRAAKPPSADAPPQISRSSKPRF